jgi:carbamoyltransferase
MEGAYLGPDYAEDQVISLLESQGAVFERLSRKEAILKTVDALTSEKVVGWFQGRMEFGPRALGNRSILADPRSDSMQKTLNLKIKFRESFRPFAPSVMAEQAKNWFELDDESPYMLFVAEVKEALRNNVAEADRNLFGIDKLKIRRSSIPAVTHVDYTARVQTVHKSTNPVFHSLLGKFFESTGFPILINTSFNVRGEPIVCSPVDAYKCFMSTGMDVLVVGNCFLKKEDQPQELKKNYIQKYELD